MSDNKHLTPVAIMYVDGQRLDVEHEGCLREIVIKDMLNGISSFHLVFDTAYTKLADKDLISLESEISIHLGYKDDVEEVFVGDVLRKQAGCSEYGTEQYEVSGCNVLHRLKHGEHSAHYEKMTPSAIIKKMIESFSLKANIEDFGVEAEFSSNDGCSAYDYLMYAATRYGKEFFADKDTIYVANEISIRNDEIILEWGKSLVAFESLLSLKRLLSRYDYVGWDVLKGESFTGGAALEDLPLKVGGEKNWTQVSKGGSGKFTGLVSDMSIADTADAKERAKGVLQKNSFWFSQARAKTEGNYKIRPGMRVTLKMIGAKFDGEYIANEVLHKFNYSDGYTTTVGLKRNMCNWGSSTGPSEMQQQQAVAASENSFRVGQDMSGGDNFTDEMVHRTGSFPDGSEEQNAAWEKAEAAKRGLNFGDPLMFMQNTSSFGYREDAKPAEHEGIDLKAPSGTPVYAAEDGIVLEADLESKRSNSGSSYLIIDHGSGYTTRSLHMDSFTVKARDTVKKGDLVGYSGTRTNVAPHLHFEIRKNNESLNPEYFLRNTPKQGGE
jgi:murein DD-endopeptidase MepM/ murein hydrolase activator NlpD